MQVPPHPHIGLQTVSPGEEIARAREDWMAGRFGAVQGYPGDPLAAAPLPDVPLRPRRH